MSRESAPTIAAKDIYMRPTFDSVTPPEYLTSIHEFSEREISDVFREDVYRAVIDSQAFRRLKEIRFLGAIDYALPARGTRPQRWHTRFQHSLGVARLAMQFAIAQCLDIEDQRTLVVAALLHDIGHAPLSHSLESAFHERFGIEHHEASEFIIRGKGPLGYPLSLVFRKFGIPVERLLRIIDGVPDEPLAIIFRGPINVDTVEAILRCYTYIGSEVLAPWRVIQAFIEKNSSILDNFWEMKDLIYGKLIASEVGVLSDYICRSYMHGAKESFWKGEYFKTEADLHKRHPDLFVRLRELRLARYKLGLQPGATISYTKRSFTIDRSQALRTYEDMPKRYKQTKTNSILSIRSALS